MGSSFGYNYPYANRYNYYSINKYYISQRPLIQEYGIKIYRIKFVFLVYPSNGELASHHHDSRFLNRYKTFSIDG